MAAAALIKFTQGVVVGTSGWALVGVASTTVHIANADNTGVQSWQVDLLYTPPDSAVAVAVPLAFSNSSASPAASFDPDVRGSYRVQLKVWSVPNRAGDPDDIDIRNFCIPGNLNFIIPPYQKDPDPLPTLASGAPGAKPNEMNINGHELGWLGANLDAMLFDFMDNIPFFLEGVTYGPGSVTDNTPVLWNGTGGQLLKQGLINLASGLHVTGVLPAANQAGQTMGGDCSGSTSTCTVAKIRGTTISTAGGSLTPGAVLRVTGSSAVDYGQVDLANTAAVTGLLSADNQGGRQPLTAGSTRDFALSDATKRILSGNVTLTIRLDGTVNFPVGTLLDGICTASQTVIAAEGGVTLTAAQAVTSIVVKAGARWLIYKSAANTWLMAVVSPDTVDFNILDFGADNTGTNAAQAAINAAITACSTTGGTVVVPKGTWKLTGTVTLANDKISIICSRGARFLKASTNFNMFTITGNYCTIENGEIDGASQAQGSGILINGGHNLIRGMYIHNVGDVTNPSSYVNGSHGICLDGQASSCTLNRIESCVVLSCHDIGISQNLVTDSFIVDCEVGSNGLEGLTVDNASHKFRGVLLRLYGNCVNGGAGGISIDGSDLGTLVGCYVSSSTSTPGIITNNNVSNSNYWNVVGGEYIGNGTYGIYLRANGANTGNWWTIAGVVLRDGGTGSIRLDANSNNNKIIGCSLNNVPISDAGSGNFQSDLSLPLTASGSRDFALTDATSKVMSGNVTLTVRLDSTVNFPIGTTIQGVCTATQTTFAAEGGVTLTVASSFVAKARVTGSQWSLYKSAANTWYLTGDLDFS
jgi:hypothetical protein